MSWMEDGVPVASLVGGEFRALPGLAPADEHAAKLALLREPGAQGSYRGTAPSECSGLMRRPNSSRRFAAAARCRASGMNRSFWAKELNTRWSLVRARSSMSAAE